MELIEFKRKIRSKIKREIIEPLRAPYLPPAYERLWGVTKDRRLSHLFAPFRGWRDRRIFRRHLRQTDIFLIGHPKSGNTWLAYMLAIILYEDIKNQITLSNIGDYVPPIHGRDSKVADYPNLYCHRAFRNEWPVYPNHYPKVIYLIRDPRAVIVSLYNMYRICFNDFERTMQAFVEEYLSQGCIRTWEPLVRWDKQVLWWIRNAERNENVMVVKYEDMVFDRRPVLEEVCRFGGIACSDEIFDLAEARGSFEAMRTDEKKHGAESYPGEVGQRGQFVRRGKIDGWKEEMDSFLVEQIEAEFAQAMKVTGYLP